MTQHKTCKQCDAAFHDLGASLLCWVCRLPDAQQPQVAIVVDLSSPESYELAIRALRGPDHEERGE